MAAVYPVTGSGAFDTNPSYSGAFIPTLWSGKLLAKFYQNTMLSEVTNTDYEGELKNQGDTVRIRLAPSISMSMRSGRSGMGLGLPDTMNSRGAWVRCVSSKTVITGLPCLSFCC